MSEHAEPSDIARKHARRIAPQIYRYTHNPKHHELWVARVIDEAIQELCHDRPPSDVQRFFDGCHEHQCGLFGTSERTKMQAEIDGLKARVELMEPHFARIGWSNEQSQSRR